jgi:NAD(P)H-hydrate repair Nnr-like enzyme with NAD(P)H-hydrate dehydratase domain
MYDTVFHTILNRPDDAHKYQCGHLLVIGGSPGMVGAPLLAAEAAMRIGAGLVTIGSTGPVIDKLESRVKEIMTVSLSEDPAAALQAVVTFVRERSVSAIVIGPGSKADRLVTELLANITVPLVIDGGGLAALHGHLELLKGSTTAI